LPLTPVLILKATLGQKPKNQPSSSLIILKKSPAIIVTGNIKRMAKISETASGITFLAGSNSGKKGGPFFCPEVDIRIISISKQDAVQLKNLLNIFSDGPKANQLFKSSNYVAHASHGNTLKINFTDYNNSGNSFSWEENIMIVQSGFLKQIANLMDGEV